MADCNQYAQLPFITQAEAKRSTGPVSPTPTPAPSSPKKSPGGFQISASCQAPPLIESVAPVQDPAVLRKRRQRTAWSVMSGAGILTIGQLPPLPSTSCSEEWMCCGDALRLTVQKATCHVVGFRNSSFLVQVVLDSFLSSNLLKMAGQVDRMEMLGQKVNDSRSSRPLVHQLLACLTFKE